ncbi:hypothetical protein LTR56_005599 [Elasticomyces elasticus]|nr:hypothetical protein LTR56_005599 [Elasticomyces elasticus]KAK3664013.1 hypothetical protein LTR22_005233 [Elasticomyces elasticus]KAK4927339.1 hypothetical protein LTR49_005744 [Elasticomyces elasticus]KAK5763305.1 hypothetical protein LTS12_006480 [Elasticomyces elasticus]
MTTSPEWFAAFFADEDVAIWKPLLYALTTFFAGTTVLYAITKLATTPRILRIPNASAGSSPTILILRAFYLLETVLRPPTAEEIEDRHCPICKDDFSDPVYIRSAIGLSDECPICLRDLFSPDVRHSIVDSTMCSCAAGIWLNIGNVAIAVSYLPTFFPEKLPLATDMTLLVSKVLITAGLLAWYQASFEWQARKSLRGGRCGQAATSLALVGASVMIASADLDGIKFLLWSLTFGVHAPLNTLYAFDAIKNI